MIGDGLFAPIANGKVVGMRKILVVVDMQKDFIDGALGTVEAQKIVKPVIEKMKDRKSVV